MRRVGLLVALVVGGTVGGGAAIPSADNFQGGPGGLSANWTTDSDQAPQRASGIAFNPNNTVVACAHWSADVYGANQYSQFTVTNVVSFQYVEATVRASGTSDATHAAYTFAVDNGGGAEFSGLYVFVAGVNTLLAAYGGSVVPGDVVRLTVAGITLTATKNGAVVATATDATIASGQPGFCIQGNQPNLDAWSADQVAAPPAGTTKRLTLTGIGL